MAIEAAKKAGTITANRPPKGKARKTDGTLVDIPKRAVGP
jgi:hypothetical protein